MHSSVGDIRTRLFALLGRAFALVLFLLLFFFLAVFSYFLGSPSPRFPAPFSAVLEGYYIGHGSWDGVASAFDANRELRHLDAILLDKERRVVLDRRPGTVLTPGFHYEIHPGDIELPLSDVKGENIGTLVITSFSLPARFNFVREIIIPAGIISFILALFLVVVAVLLVRRFVNPLADVIYAAHSVANGKLGTRIPTKGPQDLRSLSESFNEMASSLERNDRERRDMLADITHELRTPLSVIRGRLEGIVDGIYSADDAQVSLALEQTYLLERLVDDLRLLTLAETRQLPFDKRAVNIVDVVERALEVFSAEAQEKNIFLSFSEKNGNLSAVIDPQRFEQVISNLLGNALRYVPEGGKVWVTASGTADGLHITVNDNGAGIPDDDLPYIFDRFWRKEKSRSRVSGGTGLGLAIAKQLVEAQGGQITARNLLEGGLQVEIVFKGLIT